MVGLLETQEKVRKPVDRLSWLGKRESINASQLEAGEMLYRDHQVGARLSYAAASPESARGGSRSPFEARLIAKERVERALTAIGEPGGSLLRYLILENLGMRQVAEIMGWHHLAVLPAAEIALGALDTFYARTGRS